MDSLTTAEIKIWGEVVGAVTWMDALGCAAFEFDPRFLNRGLDLSPCNMPLAEARRGEIFSFPNLDPLTFHGLPGMLAGCLPDNWGNRIIDSWLRRKGRDPKSFNPVERLCYIGTRGMGALEFHPQLSDRALNRVVPVEVSDLMELVREVMSEKLKMDTRFAGEEDEKAKALLAILRVGTSAGGAVPKAVIAMNNEGHIISGQADNTPPGYTHWILKFDGAPGEQPNELGDTSGMGRVEYAYYLMAGQAGIDMTECDLLEENDRAHFITKRFDRLDGQKIHMLPLACMAHFGWNPVGAYGYEDAFAIMRELGLDYKAQAQQYRRMVFNAVAKNLDDHTKNISYTMDPNGVWKLSPAYDVTFSYSSADLLGDRLKMKINGKQKGFTAEDFLSVAGSVGINRPGSIINEVIDSVSNWPDHAQKANLSKNLTNRIEDIIYDSPIPVQGRFSKIRRDELKKRYIP